MENKVKKISTLKSNIKNSHLNKQKFQNLKVNKKLKSAESVDFYTISKQNIERYFQNLENFIPTYHQIFTELQLEYLQLCENVFKSSNFFQRDLIKNLDLDRSYVLPKIISYTMESTIKSYQIRNEMILSSIESFKDIIKYWNIMFLSYSDAYKKFYFKKDLPRYKFSL